LALAAHLSKADLTTEMVFEMAELQGVMGGLYAREEGLPEGVWKAIYDHYKPASMEDGVPDTANGAILSVADKLDTIVGCFGMGIIPKGSKDPFALRRQAQGVIRVLLEHELDYPLVELVRVAAEGFEGHQFGADVQKNALEFLRQRVLFVCREQGISYDVLNAVAATGIEKVHDTFEKAKALQEIKPQTDFEALAVAFKRVKNILSKQDFEKGVVSRDDLEDESERELFERTEALKPKVRVSLGQSDYLGALRQIASLRGPVDAFFDEVLVLTKDTRLRNNRLRLLAEISEIFLEIADISEIVTPAS
jgi:glycyl-tRNA synthetase beta chain